MATGSKCLPVGQGFPGVLQRHLCILKEGGKESFAECLLHLGHSLRCFHAYVCFSDPHSHPVQLVVRFLPCRCGRTPGSERLSPLANVRICSRQQSWELGLGLLIFSSHCYFGNTDIYNRTGAFLFSCKDDEMT